MAARRFSGHFSCECIYAIISVWLVLWTRASCSKRSTVAPVRRTQSCSAFIGVPSPVHFRMRPNLRDGNDNAFVELAFASGSSYLITQNIRDFTVDADLNLGHLTVVTPVQFMQQWRKTHGNEA